ncbi:MAG: hypothetical protein MUF02_07435, partial [Acidobacteria bacterium]|nr:hypothetical protein [Acidobacteriota bacterium]
PYGPAFRLGDFISPCKSGKSEVPRFSGAALNIRLWKSPAWQPQTVMAMGFSRFALFHIAKNTDII